MKGKQPKKPFTVYYHAQTNQWVAMRLGHRNQTPLIAVGRGARDVDQLARGFLLREKWALREEARKRREALAALEGEVIFRGGYLDGKVYPQGGGFENIVATNTETGFTEVYAFTGTIDGNGRKVFALDTAPAGRGEGHALH